MRFAIGAAFTKDAPEFIFAEPGREQGEKIDLVARRQRLLEEQAKRQAEEEAQKALEEGPVKLSYE